MIRLNFQSAEEIARTMDSAVVTVESASEKTYAKATNTTLIVNKKVQENNDEIIRLVKDFGISFRQTLRNIELVNREFEITDRENERRLKQSFSFTNNLLDRNYIFERVKGK